MHANVAMYMMGQALASLAEYYALEQGRKEDRQKALDFTLHYLEQAKDMLAHPATIDQT